MLREETTRRSWNDNIKLDVKEIWCEDVVGFVSDSGKELCSMELQH
jgi:hypothetical protein